ncbi:hypothetical protein HMPREF9062_0269 [Actinomyces sp. oral taxon 448 str. F0400]|nr:hypothetical protein HMPREF9062_0269 [Actinomyces sp. oral taxon 448 str. F0400]
MSSGSAATASETSTEYRSKESLMYLPSVSIWMHHLSADGETHAPSLMVLVVLEQGLDIPSSPHMSM